MRIHRIRGLIAYAYLIETAEDLFLVDGGMVGSGHKILRRIAAIKRTPEELSFALVTHAHADHFGGLAEIQEVSNCTVFCHPLHVEMLQQGHGAVSPGINVAAKAYERLATFALPRLRLPRLRQVMPVADGAELHRLGLPGRVLHTPGHSAGDLTLVLDDGSAFVGDLVQGSRIPKLMPPELSSMAADESEMLASWRALLESGARVVYPGHGYVVTVDEMVPVFHKALKRLSSHCEYRSRG